MRNNSSSEHHQNNNLKVVITFGNFIGNDNSFLDTTKKLENFNNDNVSQKDKLLALKIVKETCESKFSLLEKGPSVMALNSLQERVEKIESNNEFR